MHYVAAQDGAVASVVREFLAEPGCDDARFAEIELKLGHFESSQLSAAIVGCLEQRMVSYIKEQVGLGAGGLRVLRAIYQRSAMKTRDLRHQNTNFFYWLIHFNWFMGAQKQILSQFYRGNPKLEHGQGLVNDQTCLNK